MCCERTNTALQVLKSQPNNGGLSEAACMLFEQVIEDNKKTTKKVEALHDDVNILKKDFQTVKCDVARILSIIDRPSWFCRFWEQYGSKIVLSILFLMATLFCKIAIPELIELWKAFQ